jgi:hypothetical protein
MHHRNLRVSFTWMPTPSALAWQHRGVTGALDTAARTGLWHAVGIEPAPGPPFRQLEADCARAMGVGDAVRSRLTAPATESMRSLTARNRTIHERPAKQTSISKIRLAAP